MTVAASFPPAFVTRVTAQLGSDAPAYFEAMTRPPVRGLRLNPLKKADAPLETLVEGLYEPVPWEPDGRYLSLESNAGLHPLHEGGAYYLQEPSAMIPARVLNAQPGETVLDLCAAPGGKSTQLAAAMAGRGTLVCNEFVPARAQVLSRNLERMGATNAVVVSADPDALAKRWPMLFDAVLVDAPCSGEGMFRRHPEARLEWDAAAPARCAARQARILESACAMLKPGGRLCYATCTLNPEENEDTIAALCAAHPELTPVSFSVPIGGGRQRCAQNGGLHLYPHAVQGEGHFVALLQKTARSSQDAQAACTLYNPAQCLAAPMRPAVEAFTALWGGLSLAAAPLANAQLGDTLLSAPSLPPLKNIRVLRAGLSLGQLKGKQFAPDHALAMAAPPFALAGVVLDHASSVAYQRGEALPLSQNLRGYLTVTLHGIPLGFVKASDGWLKNHYPKGLRRP